MWLLKVTKHFSKQAADLDDHTDPDPTLTGGTS